MSFRILTRLSALIVAVSFVLNACGGGGGGDDSSVPSVPTYGVIYDGNGSSGGSVPIDSTSYKQDQIVTVPGNSGVLEKTGYLFTGWNTQADGSGVTYTQAQTFVMGAANVTLYAKWTANLTFTVTYDGNGSTGGSVPVDSTHYEQGMTVVVLGNSGNLVKSGYTFAGWNTQADGLGSDYVASGASTFVMGVANVTLYARWTANPAYTVTYDGNGNTGGSVPVDSTHYEQGMTVTSSINSGNLIKDHYEFIGWNTQADGNGTPYLVMQSFTMGLSDVRLYAMWGPIHTTIYAIKDGSTPYSTVVALDNLLVTGRNDEGYYLQVKPGDAVYNPTYGANYSGIFVLDPISTVQVGDRIAISSAIVMDNNGQIVLANPAITVVSSMDEIGPEPVQVLPSEVATGGVYAATLEAVIVQVSNVTVTDINPVAGSGDSAPINEFVIDDALRVNDALYLITPFPTVDSTFTSLSGILDYRNGNSKLEPRNVADAIK